MADIVRECLDMDQWKHSWHNSLETKSEKLQAIAVLEEKIDARLDQIQKLRGAIRLLRARIEGPGADQ